MVKPPLSVRSSYSALIYVVCTVEDHSEGFIFHTATLGNMPLDPQSFFMYMGGSKVEGVEYSADPSGVTSAIISGGLACRTKTITASGTFGGVSPANPPPFRHPRGTGLTVNILNGGVESLCIVHRFDNLSTTE
jgi:hypothetical protein